MLPVLRVVLEALQQFLLLLLLRLVEAELEHRRRAIVAEEPLERVDGVVADAQAVGVGPAADFVDEHVFVVRADEEADLALRRGVRVDAPEEVVRLLVVRRRLERDRADTDRVAAAEDVPRDAVLAARVHPLQDDEHRARALSPQQRLPLADVRGEGGGFLARGVFVEVVRGFGRDVL